MELLNYSEVRELNGKVSFKLDNTIYKLEFIQDSDTEDGEEPQFWKITLARSDSLIVQMIPSHLPWSLPGQIEIRASCSWRRDSVLHLLCLIIATEDDIDDIPDWMAKVFAIIDDLTVDLPGNTLPISWLSEE